MTSDVNLSEREQLVLQAVVHMYITTAEPAGSRALVKRFGLDFSPATVRNVMADLEDSGFLQQLHSSSGRVPTNRGYRHYVDYLMRVQQLTLAERARIEQELTRGLNDADELLRQTSHLLALVTHQTGIVEAPQEREAIVQTIELMPISNHRMALLLADSYGRIRTMTVNLEQPISSDDLSRTRQYLNDILRGVQVEHIKHTVETKARMIQDEQRRLAEQALHMVETLPLTRPGQLFLDGANQLFEQPEFHDIERAREVFLLLEEREQIIEMLRKGMRNAPPWTSVLIGSEAARQGFDEISVIAAPYCVKGKAVGMLGVLGPRRMPYPRLTAVVEYTADMLGRILTRLAG